ncbi:MAG: endo-1,4-beta-xylanase [Oscillospiraceae bacterium]|nr:endo-1,4-beta-xylanase [Oscillospiraceae bacterium]
MKQKLLALISAGAIAAGSLPMTVSAETVTKHDTANGYVYDAVYDPVEGAEDDAFCAYSLNDDGSFSAGFENVEAARISAGRDISRAGYSPFSSWKSVDYSYSGAVKLSGNAYFGVQLTSSSKKQVCFIVEQWGTWKPTSISSPSTLLTDGIEYKVFHTEKQYGMYGFSESGTDQADKDPEPVDVYWSVRNVKPEEGLNEGTISISNHITAWEKLGLDTKDLVTGVQLFAEGYGADAAASLKIMKNQLYGTHILPIEDKTVPYKTVQDGQPFRAHQNKNYTYNPNGDGLKDIMGPYFRIGAGINAYEITDEKTQEFVLKNFNTLTAENEMKPEAIIQEVNGTDVTVNLNGASNILKFAEENGIGVRGHCFVWYSQTPDILFRDGQTYCDAETADARIDSMIGNTFKQLETYYPDLDLYAYDVCNEILQNEKGGLRKQSGDPNDISRWANVYGENSIGHVLAGFRAARKYAPENCKLFLSDYNEYIPEKTEGLVNLAKQLMKEDLIDGIGMQAHLATSYPDSELFESALKQFHALGLDVEITELDIIKGYQGTDAQRRRLWKEIFKAAMTNADFISSVSFYTTSGITAWDADPETELFRYLGKDQGYRPLPAYYDVIALADEIPSPADIAADVTKTTASAVTTGTGTVPEPKTGDANCDGAVDVSDAVMIARFVNSDRSLVISDQGIANADFDGNGQTDTDDITAILKMIARII